MCPSIRHLSAYCIENASDTYIIIIFSSAYGSAIIAGILFPILNNFAKVGQVPPTELLNTDGVNKFHDYY